jgi:predicted nucleic acid-binding protein
VILVDAGPLVALVDADDHHHKACVHALSVMDEPLATVWPALTEAMYLLRDVARGQDAVWEMIERGAVQVLPLGPTDVSRMRALMKKYADRPMDVADAALVTVAEREGLRTVFTVDRGDFSIYRLHGRTRFTVLP